MPGRTRLAAALAVLTLAPATLAQQGQPSPRPPERTVYVPIEDFDQIFDRERGGVFVPYHELLRLLERAQGRTPPVQPPTDVQPPADFVLVGAQLKGTAGERVVQFEATFDIEVLARDEWVIVPVGLGEAALEELRTSDGQRAVVGPMATLIQQMAQRQTPEGRGRRPAPPPPAQGYGVIMKGPGRTQVQARFAVPISSRPGQSSFALTLPGAALCNFEVTLPQSGLRVNVANALATEESSLEAADQTRVRAYFGATAQAQVTWNPRPKQVEGEARDPLLFAETEASLFLDEGVIQTLTRIDYRILQAPCGEFVLRFPKGYTLLSVQGENMSADPAPEEDGEEQLVRIRLHEKAKDSYALLIKLERILGEEGPQELAFPRVVTVGTERESGVLAARCSRFLTLEPAELKGLSQVDVGSLSERLSKDLGWDRAADPRPPLVFRYLRQPYSLRLKSSQIEPEVDGKVLTLTTVRDDEIELRTTVAYTIRKRGIFGVRIQLPAGLDIRQCSPENLVKDYRVRDGVLQVDFVNQVQPGELFLNLIGTLRRPQAESERLELPLVHLLDVKKETGVLGVGSVQHLQLKEAEKKGLLPQAVRDLAGLGFPYGPASREEELMFGYRYGKPDNVSAAFSVEKREPKVSARVETHLDAQEDLVAVDATVNFKVEYAGIEQVRIRVPAALRTEEALKITGDGIRTPQVTWKEGEPTAIWTVPLQSKKPGEFPIHLHYDIKLDDLAPGQRKDVPLHELEVLDVFTETGDLALTKHENLVISDELEMLERRDKRELPESLRRLGPIQAYRYVSHPHRLTLQIVKYDFQAPLGILIDHLHTDEILDRDGRLQVEAWLALKNNTAQFLTVQLPTGAEFIGLKVDGRTLDWSLGSPRDGHATVLVHLGEVAQARRNQAFQVRLRYNVPALGRLQGMGRVELPALGFPLEGTQSVPVARLTRALYLPRDLAYLEFDTDATKHFDETTLWEDAKHLFEARTGREGYSVWEGAQDAQEAIAQLKGLTGGSQDLGQYPALDLPRETPFLFEKLDNPARLSVRFSSWTLFYFLDALVLVLVIALGAFAERRGLIGAAGYVTGAAGLALLGANFGGKAAEPFFHAGFLGALGLGAYFLGRGAWRELTVRRHERRLAELAEEAQVAKARAQAAEAELRLRGAGPAPGAGAATAVATKAKELTEAERQAARDIPLDRPDQGGQGQA